MCCSNPWFASVNRYYWSRVSSCLIASFCKDGGADKDFSLCWNTGSWWLREGRRPRRGRSKEILILSQNQRETLWLIFITQTTNYCFQWVDQAIKPMMSSWAFWLFAMSFTALNLDFVYGSLSFADPSQSSVVHSGSFAYHDVCAGLWKRNRVNTVWTELFQASDTHLHTRYTFECLFMCVSSGRTSIQGYIYSTLVKLWIMVESVMC